MKRFIFSLLTILPLISHSQDLKFILPEGSKTDVLTKAGEVTTPYYYRISSQGKSYIVLDNKLCMNFNDTTAPILSFHNFPELTDILFCDSSSYIVSDSSSIYYYDEEYNFFVKLVDSQMHNICFSVSNTGIYYYDKDNGKELYFYQYSDTSSIKVCQFATPITSVAPLGSLCFVAYGKKICMINENSEYTRLFESSSTITSLAVHSSGMLFYGTSEGLFYFDNNDRQYQITDLGVQDLLIDGENMFVIFFDGSSIKITSISEFYNITEEYEKQQKNKNIAELYKNGNDLVKLITTKDEIDLTDVGLTTIPSMGIFMLAGNQMFPLSEEDTILSLTFPDYMYIDDIFWSDYDFDFVVKSGFDVYKMDDYSEPALSFDSENYSIFPWDSARVFIAIQHSDSSSLFFGSLKFGRVKRLLTIKEHIIYVYAIGTDTFVVTTENIYLFDDKNKKCVRMLNFWAPVHTAVMTNKGLLFATDEEICLLKDIDTFATLFEGSCLKLLYDYKYLYILTSDYDLYSIDLSQL